MSENQTKYNAEPSLEYLSPPQMADRLNVSSNTVRRYMKRFKGHFKGKKKFGIHWRYPLDPTMDTLKKIHSWYRRGLSRPEIENMLSDGADDTTPTPVDPMEVLGQKIDRLTDAITHMNTLIESHPAIIPGSGQMVHEITATANKLISDTTPTQYSDDIMTTPDNEKSGQTTNPEKNNSITESSEIATNKGQTDSSRVVSFSVADDKETPPVTHDIDNNPEDYRRHVIGIIVGLKNQGKTLKEIKAELEARELSTFTGLKAWAIGTIGNLYRKHKEDL